MWIPALEEDLHSALETDTNLILGINKHIFTTVMMVVYERG